MTIGEGSDSPGSERSVERRIVTVLFADLVGFTPLSERLDPEDVATIQDAYFASVRETIGRYGGVVEKFIGDAAMAVFGVPRARDDDPERAVRAGFALLNGIEHLAARLGLAPGELRLRVGINTGEVVYADAGPDQGRVTGDTVNTAARLQAAAAPDTILVGESTALAVEDAIQLERLPSLALKGKSEPARVARAVDVRAERSRELAMGGLRAPMLGREVELGRLLAALEDVAAAGRPQHWLVVAPPGVGKTRLLDEFATHAAARGAVVRRLRLRPEASVPFSPIAELLRLSLRLAGGDAPEASATAPRPLLRLRLEAAGMTKPRAKCRGGRGRRPRGACGAPRVRPAGPPTAMPGSGPGSTRWMRSTVRARPARRPATRRQRLRERRPSAHGSSRTPTGQTTTSWPSSRPRSSTTSPARALSWSRPGRLSWSGRIGRASPTRTPAGSDWTCRRSAGTPRAPW